MRRLLGGVVLAAAATLVGAPAAAQDVGVSISPPRVEIDQDHSAISLRFRLANTTRGVRDVEMQLRGLGHDLDGTPAFGEDPSLAGSLTLAPATFSLRPGESQEVTVAGSIPAGRPALYAGVVALLDGGAGQVQVETHLGALVLLRGPRPWQETVEIETIGPINNDGPPYELTAVVRNTGDVHIRPRGRMDVVAADGSVLATFELPAEIVLPGYARRLGRFPWTPPAGLSGPVTLRVELGEPAATGTATLDIGAPQAADRPGAPAGPAADAPRATPLDPGLVTGSALLLILVGLACLLAWRRRRDPRSEGPEPAPAATEPERVGVSQLPSG